MKLLSSAIFLLLFNATVSYAQNEIGHPKNQFLALEDADHPEMVHIECEPFGDDKIKCKRIEITIKSNRVRSFEELKSIIENDIKTPGALEGYEKHCEKIKNIPTNRAELEKLKKGNEKELTNAESKLLNWSLDGLKAAQKHCKEEPTVENTVKFAMKSQKREELNCKINWMPSQEKIYSYDRQNEQWTYRLDMEGLCGRQITTENITRAKPPFDSLHRLEILNLYPDMDEKSECKLGLNPEKKKRVYSHTSKKFWKECLFFSFN